VFDIDWANLDMPSASKLSKIKTLVANTN
jgi:hypothetical protein